MNNETEMAGCKEGYDPQHSISSRLLSLPEELITKIIEEVNQGTDRQQNKEPSESIKEDSDRVDKDILQVQLTCKQLRRISGPFAFATVRLSRHMLNTREHLPSHIKGLVSTLFLDHQESPGPFTEPETTYDLSTGADEWSQVRNVFITAKMTEGMSRNISEDRLSAPTFGVVAEDDSWMIRHPALSLLQKLQRLTLLNLDGVDNDDGVTRIMGNILQPATLDHLKSLKHVVLGLSCRSSHALVQIAPQKSSTSDTADFEVTYVYRKSGRPEAAHRAMSALNQSVRKVLSSPRTKILRIINSSYILGDLAVAGTLPDPLGDFRTEDGVRRALESPTDLHVQPDEPIGNAVSADDKHRVQWLDASSADPKVISALIDIPPPIVISDHETIDPSSALTGLILGDEFLGAAPRATSSGGPYPDLLAELSDQD